jgi:hypothetical protein
MLFSTTYCPAVPGEDGAVTGVGKGDPGELLETAIVKSCRSGRNGLRCER